MSYQSNERVPLVEHCLRVFVCEILQEIFRSSSPPVLNFFYPFPARDIFLIAGFQVARVPPFPWNGEGGTLATWSDIGLLSLSRAVFVLIRSWGAKWRVLNLSLSWIPSIVRKIRNPSVCHSIDVVYKVCARSGEDISILDIVRYGNFRRLREQ